VVEREVPEREHPEHPAVPAASIAGSIPERIARKIAGWVYRHGTAAIEREARAADERRATLRDLRDNLDAAMSAARYDRERGHPESREVAPRAARRAASLAREIESETARAAVLEWREAFERTPSGWHEHGGATAAQMAELEAAYEEAAERIGEALRRPPPRD
jgi:hypothetical protein